MNTSIIVNDKSPIFKQQQKLIQSQDEDQKLQKLHERREDSCQTEILLSIQQIENTLQKRNNNLQQNADQSFEISIHHQFGENSGLTSLGQNDSSQRGSNYHTNRLENYQYFDKVKEQESKNLDHLEESLPSNIKSSSQSDENVYQRRNREKKRLTYNYNLSPRKENKQQTQKVIKVNKIGNTNNQIDEIQLLTKIRLRMIKFYKKYTQFGKRAQLTNPLILENINDKSDFRGKLIQSRFQAQRRWIGRQFKKIKFIQNIPLFNPQHPACFIVQAIICLLNCLFYIFFCTIIVFNPGFSQEYNLFQFIFVFWSIEILIKLNTAVYINTDLVQKREQIIKIYMKNNAIYDFIPIILVLLLDFIPVFGTLFKIICFIKLKNIITDLHDFQKQICMAVKQYYYIQLFNLIAKVFIIGHIIACLWYLVGQAEVYLELEDSNWYSTSLGADGIWWKLYIEAFYWALTLMTTGSNEPTTVTETFFTSFIMLFTTIIFCYFLNSISNILSDFDEEEINMKNDINIINEFMRTHNISRNLQRRVNKDLEYFYEKNYKKLKEDNESVMDKLSPNLKELINNESYRKYIDKIEFITKNFSNETIERLCQQIEELYFTPNQIIFKETDTDNPCLIYIIDGQSKLIQLHFQAHYFQLCNIIQNNYLATLQFLILYLILLLQLTILSINNFQFSFLYLQFLFFIIFTVELFKEGQSKNSKGNQFLSVVDKDNLIGQFSFFTGQQRYEIAKSKSFTTVLQISREQFINILKQNEQDYEKFCQIKDNALLYKNYYNIGIKCSVCKQYSHFLQDCPQIHFDRNAAYSKAKMFECIKQNREKMQRKSKFINTLNEQNKIAQIARLFEEANSYVRSMNSIKEEDIIDEVDMDKEMDSVQQILIDKISVNKSSNMTNEEQDEKKARFLTEQFNTIDFNLMMNQSDSKNIKMNSLDVRNRIFLRDDNFDLSQKKKSLEISLTENSSKRHLESSMTRSNNRSNLDQNPLPTPEINRLRPRKASRGVFRFETAQFNDPENKIQQSSELKKFQFYDNTNIQTLAQFQPYSEWDFDKQKDYQIYYPESNLTITLYKFNLSIRKKYKKTTRKVTKK